jgi:hypothetical protein
MNNLSISEFREENYCSLNPRNSLHEKNITGQELAVYYQNTNDRTKKIAPINRGNS